MRISPNGLFLSLISSAAFSMIGCTSNGSSSLLGEENPFAKTMDSTQTTYERAPFFSPSLDDSSYQPPVEIAPAVPQTAGNDLLNTGFEEESGSCWNTRNSSGYAAGSCGRFVNIGTNAFKLSESGISHSGSKAVQITYQKNEDVASTDVGIDADTVNVRSWYYFDKDFDFGQGVKIGRVTSHNSATGMNDVDIIMTVRSAQGGNQCGVTDMADIAVLFNGAPKGYDWGSISPAVRFERQKWYAVEYQVILNKVGQSDGSVRLWIDGALKAEKTGIRIRANSARLNGVKIGGWYSNSAHGNSCANPAAPSRLYMDDVIISKGFIGMR